MLPGLPAEQGMRQKDKDAAKEIEKVRMRAPPCWLATLLLLFCFACFLLLLLHLYPPPPPPPSPSPPPSYRHRRPHLHIASSLPPPPSPTPSISTVTVTVNITIDLHLHHHNRHRTIDLRLHLAPSPSSPNPAGLLDRLLGGAGDDGARSGEEGDVTEEMEEGVKGEQKKVFPHTSVLFSRAKLPIWKRALLSRLQPANFRNRTSLRFHVLLARFCFRSVKRDHFHASVLPRC
ncbi:hypothetical protein ACLB2K_066432 [Fragaria x ananassa]